MDSNKKLIDDLAQAAYDSGYYSGKREDGQPHHLEAIEKRRRASDRILQRLAAVSDLLAALSPFAALYNEHFDDLDDDVPLYQHGYALITVGNVRRAKAAIAGARGGG